MQSKITNARSFSTGVLLAGLLGIALPVGSALAQFGSAPPPHPLAPQGQMPYPGDRPRSPQLIKDMTPEGYRLRIPLRAGQQAADIRIQPQGRALIIHSQHQHYRESEQQDAQGRQLSRGFSVSSGHFRRRVALPPDADPGAMQRTDQEDAVVVILPRR